MNVDEYDNDYKCPACEAELLGDDKCDSCGEIFAVDTGDEYGSQAPVDAREPDPDDLQGTLDRLLTLRNHLVHEPSNDEVVGRLLEATTEATGMVALLLAEASYDLDVVLPTETRLVKRVRSSVAHAIRASGVLDEEVVAEHADNAAREIAGLFGAHLPKDRGGVHTTVFAVVERLRALAEIAMDIGDPAEMGEPKVTDAVVIDRGAA